MALDPLHKDRQITVINRNLTTALKIKEDIIEKFRIEDNFLLGGCNLIHYRIKNSALEIAEDLASDYNQTVEERYGLIKDDDVKNSVGAAFRGHNDVDFGTADRFEGLFRKELADYIKSKRHSLVMKRNLQRINPETGERYIVEHSKKYGRANARSGALQRGQNLWSEEDGSANLELITLDALRTDSIGSHSRKCDRNKVNHDYVLEHMIEEFPNRTFTRRGLERAYQNNKHLLDDEEE
tara:strand:- start:206 stop:922 length:717 start_codon:yes stop_codon:yes gene_type:complete